MKGEGGSQVTVVAPAFVQYPGITLGSENVILSLPCPKVSHANMAKVNSFRTRITEFVCVYPNRDIVNNSSDISDLR